MHAKEALDNSIKYFPELMNEKIENSILRHMFPLNKVPPKYKIAWIVTLADKWGSLDTIKNPSILISFLKPRNKRR